MKGRSIVSIELIPGAGWAWLGAGIAILIFSLAVICLTKRGQPLFSAIKSGIVGPIIGIALAVLGTITLFLQ